MKRIVTLLFLSLSLCSFAQESDTLKYQKNPIKYKWLGGALFRSPVYLPDLADESDTVVAIVLPSGKVSYRKLSKFSGGGGEGDVTQAQLQAAADTLNQTLSIDGSTLTISGGNSVEIPAGGDVTQAELTTTADTLEANLELKFSNDAAVSVKSANEYSHRPVTVRIPEPYNIGQTVHPSVLYFDTPFNGYRYWMAITPYADSQNRFENPCVFASHNGVNWVVPTGLTNPIEPTPTSGADLNADYNADPNLFYNNDTLYMAFRQSITQSGFTRLYVYMVKSVDGVNWSAKKQVLYYEIMDADPDIPFLSPSIVKDGSGNVYMYYCNYDFGLNTLTLARKQITGSPMVAANYGVEQAVSITGKPDSRIPWHVEVQWDEKYGWQMLLNAASGKGGANGRLWILESSNGTSFAYRNTLLNPFFENENQILYKSSFRRLDETKYEVWYSSKGINNTWWTSYAIAVREGDNVKVANDNENKLVTTKSVVAPSVTARDINAQNLQTEYITSPTGLENAWGIGAKTGDLRWERGSNTTVSAGDSLAVLEFNSLSGNVISGTINAFKGYVKIIIDGERVLYFNTNIYAQSGDGAGFQSFTVPPIKYDESIKIMVINPNAYSVKVGWSILNVFKRAYNTAGDMTGNNTVGPDIPPSSGGGGGSVGDTLTGDASDYFTYEPNSTNLYTYSEQLNNVVWGTVNMTVGVDSAIAPDGTTSAEKITPTVTNGTHVIAQTKTVTSGTTYSVSFFVKQAGLRYIQIYGAGAGFPSSRYANFDLQTGAITANIFSSAEIASLPNDWYRISVTQTAAANGTGVIGLATINSPTATNRPSYAGDGVNGFYVWGGQMEVQNRYSSYIKTTSSTVSRGEGFNTILNGLKANLDISPSDIGQGGASVGQILKWSGTAWVPSADDTSGEATGKTTYADTIVSTNSQLYTPRELLGENYFLGRPSATPNVFSLGYRGLSTSTDYAVGQTSAGTTSINAKSGERVAFRISNTEYATLKSGGFGIANLNPSFALDVGSNMRVRHNGGLIVLADANGDSTTTTSFIEHRNSSGAVLGRSGFHTEANRSLSLVNYIGDIYLSPKTGKMVLWGTDTVATRDWVRNNTTSNSGSGFKSCYKKVTSNFTVSATDTSCNIQNVSNSEIAVTFNTISAPNGSVINFWNNGDEGSFRLLKGTSNLKIGGQNVTSDTVLATASVMYANDTFYVANGATVSGGGSTDLSGYYTKSEVDSLVSDTLQYYQLKPTVIAVSSNRNIAASDVGNTLSCTSTATLTITLNFSAMAVGDVINLEALGTTFTIEGATGVSINGVSAGDKDVGNSSVYTGGILRKTGTNSYVVL
jgi:hypothetical protein